MTQGAVAIETSQWRSLDLLSNVFRANIRALAARNAPLAERLLALKPARRLMRVQADAVQIALAAPCAATPPAEPMLQVAMTPAAVIPPVVTPASAAHIVAKVFPRGACDAAILVAGIDQGWLWRRLYDLPTSAAMPGHRPPIYLLAHDLERLWVALHLHDWQAMLADPRVLIFAGTNCIRELRDALVADARLTWPKLSVTVEPSIWPAGYSSDALLRDVTSAIEQRLRMMRQEMALPSSAPSSTARALELSQKLRSGIPLKILGITSRYTTFLQHSMRDWLDACSRLGHQAHLLIEDADHEMLNNVLYMQACQEFQPDLVLLIDHYRAELKAIPDHLPCVMWVQDALPTIFSAQAGRAQTQRDYCLGFGRLHLSDRYGFPASRFMPATVPVNEQRFAPRALTPAENAQFACQVSFVSHASMPAETIVQEQLTKLSSSAGRVITEVFDQLRAIYEAGQSLTQPILLRRMIEQAMQRHAAATELSPAGVMEFFTQRVNNALFRHQTLHWLCEMGVDLHLYGRGWEAHPKFGRFARGIADNQAQLSVIYQASRINLQVTPHGAVHQRLFEGLSAGGFFLIRRCPGDLIERVYRKLYDWCRTHHVHSDRQLQQRADAQARGWLDETRALLGIDPFEHDFSLYRTLELSADGRYQRSAGTVWPDEYDSVSFDSAHELRMRVAYYLADERERQRIASAMRAPVLERFTYLATTRRLLSFIADDLEAQSRQPLPLEAAA